jgi:hypothetical protein
MSETQVVIFVEQPPLFDLGEVVVTAGVEELLATLCLEPAMFIARHVTGDWGDLCEQDQETNQDAVEQGGRVFSSYNLPDNHKVWVITEWDRSYTTVLLPSEY